MSRTDPWARYADHEGRPVPGLAHAPRARRLSAWVLDVVLIVLTLGVGWALWTFRLWREGTTPGKRALGLVVFDTETRRPADRACMVARNLGYRGLARLIGVVTFGLGYAYVLAAAAGGNRRALYDDWAHTVVLRTTYAIRPQESVLS